MNKTRHDLAVLRNTRRGDKAKAMAAAATDITKMKAMDELKANFFAVSSKDQRATAWNTWCDLHRERFKDEEFLPINAPKLLAISAMLREGGYRTPDNYITIALQHHLD